jgi:predicted DNA-binding transcriptional regulator YafY
MPLTRSAFQRYRLIDEAISRYPYQYSKKRLFELCRDRCGIRSLSTLEKDIQTLREDHQAPIAYCKRRDGYYYRDPHFRLLKLMLTPDDMEAFERATEVLRATQGTASAQELMGALGKVRQSLDLIREVTTEPADARAVYVEDTTLGGNRQYVSVLIRAINKGLQVQFDYRKHEGEGSKRHRLHPLKLREVQDVWYLIGYEEAAGKEKTFGLDRMGNLSVTEEPCDVPEAVVHKVNQLFAHIYGITDSEGPVEEILLSFTPRRGKYVKAQPIHPSQQVVEDSAGQCLVRLSLIPNRDLMNHLRSYGPDVKILGPQSLVDAFKNDLQATLDRYHP